MQKNELLEAIVRDFVKRASEVSPKSDKEQIQDMIFREVGLSREVIAYINSENLTLEDAKRAIEKDRARRYHKIVVTRAINRLNEQIRTVRSDKYMSKLEKMIKIRDLEREKDNLSIPENRNGK